MKTNMDKKKNNRGPLITITVFLTISVFVHAYLVRPLGFMLLDMVNVTSTHNVTHTRICSHVPAWKNRSVPVRYGTFTWNNNMQANVLNVNKWVKLACMPVSGFLVTLFDPEIQLGVMTALAALATAFLPTLAYSTGYAGAMVARGMLGLCHAITSPSTDAIVAREVPPAIRSTVYTITTTGTQISMLIGLPLTAVLIDHDIFGGWPSGFYVPATLALMWTVGWLWFIYCFRGRSKRNGHALLQDRKKAGKNRCRTNLDQLSAVLTRPAVWAILPCEAATATTLSLLITFVPQYYSDVLRFKLKAISIFSALPFLAMIFTRLIASTSGDFLVNRYGFSRNTMSKLWNTVAFVGSGISILLIALLPCLSEVSIVALVTLCAGLYSISTPGFRVSRTSLSKRWTGIVAAAADGVFLLTDIIFTYVVKSVVVQQGTEAEWKYVFIAVFVLDLFAAAIYAMFGSVVSLDVAEADEGIGMSHTQQQRETLLERSNT